MLFKLLLIATLSAIAGAAKAVADKIDHHFSRSIFRTLPSRWWNPTLSWKNKYRNYDAGDKREAFPLSKTWLVAFTDAWHFFGSLQRASLLVAAALAGYYFQSTGWYGMAIALICQIAVFHVFYTYLFDEKSV